MGNFVFLIRPLRFVAMAISADSTPRQVTLGFAMGMVIGLVPKGNLIAVALMTILCASRVNLAAGMLSAFLFSWVGMLIDPLTDKIGYFLLNVEPLIPYWTVFANQPVVPWTNFNNTVVLGSLVTGLILCYPLYLLSQPLIARLLPILSAKIRRMWIGRVLLGAEWTGKIIKPTL